MVKHKTNRPKSDGEQMLADTGWESNPEMNERTEFRVPTSESMEMMNSLRHHTLASLSDEQHRDLVAYLRARLMRGSHKRTERLNRCFTIDRQISTWQKQTIEDSKRLAAESNDGRPLAIRSNLPVLAAHLEDLTAFYADTLAPIGTPFISTDVSAAVAEVVRRLSRDVIPRNYYLNIATAARAGLKYNLTGVLVEWDGGAQDAGSAHGSQPAGNNIVALSPHNTLWDSSVVNPVDLSTKGEWGAVVEPVTHAQMMRNKAADVWFDLDRIPSASKGGRFSGVFDSNESHNGMAPMRLWLDPASAVPTADGADSLDFAGDHMDLPDWAALGLSIPADIQGADLNHTELTKIYCWITPERHGLLSEEEKAQIRDADRDPKSFVELWRFELINNSWIVSASPAAPRDRTLNGEAVVIPIFMSYLIHDQLGSAQRSPMELVVPFQRLASAMYALGTEAVRKGVYGTKIYDPSVVDGARLESGETAQVLKSKVPGRDVRTALAELDNANGGEKAFGLVPGILSLKSELFPSQSLPAQIAGLDRAVTNQVSSIIHGAQRGLRMSLRLMDSTMLLPARMETVRNLRRYEPLNGEDIDDETIAKSLGSGVDSLESERITEALWRLLMAIIQNQEAMQRFDVPAIMAYLGEVLRVNVDMSKFTRGEQQPQAGAGMAGAGAGAASQEDPAGLADQIAAQAAQAGAGVA